MKPHKKIKNHNLTDPYQGYKTFKDLKFYAHKLGGKQAIMQFDNKHRISVVGGRYSIYGDGVNTFETWRSCDSDVKGYLTPEEVTEEMVELQKLGPNTPRVGF